MEFQLSAVNVLHLLCQQIWKTQQWPQDRKRSVFILIPKKGNAKECSNYCITAHMLARLRSKSLKTGFSSMWTESFQMYKLDFEKAEEPVIKLATSVGSWRKQGNCRQMSTSVTLTKLMPLTVNLNKLLKILKEMGVPHQLICSLRNLHVS